jgi:hypothetical protein
MFIDFGVITFVACPLPVRLLNLHSTNFFLGSYSELTDLGGDVRVCESRAIE